MRLFFCSLLILFFNTIFSIDYCEDDTIYLSGYTLYAYCYKYTESYGCSCIPGIGCFQTCYRNIWGWLNYSDISDTLRFNNMDKCGNPKPLEVNSNSNLRSYCHSCYASNNNINCICNYITIENIQSTQWTSLSLNFLTGCGDRICKK
jgi:hypothetical protein